MIKSIREGSLEYGFSVLHAYIRFMEMVLHISYRLEFKTWRVSKSIKKINTIISYIKSEIIINSNSDIYFK